MFNPMHIEKKMTLIGFVGFRGPCARRSTDLANAQPVGHYTGFVKRGNTWCEYDDLTCKCQVRKETHRVSPHLLIFSNI